MRGRVGRRGIRSPLHAGDANVIGLGATVEVQFPDGSKELQTGVLLDRYGRVFAWGTEWIVVAALHGAAGRQPFPRKNLRWGDVMTL